MENDRERNGSFDDQLRHNDRGNSGRGAGEGSCYTKDKGYILSAVRRRENIFSDKASTFIKKGVEPRRSRAGPINPCFFHFF